MALLLDTHILVWLAAGDARLKAPILETIIDPSQELFLSSVIAWEYAELERRGRFAGAGPLQPLVDQLEITVLAVPANLWTLVTTLPQIHRDPIDRMLIAHALTLDIPLVTADANIQRYPIATLWD